MAEVIKEDKTTVGYQWKRDRELIPVLRYIQDNIPGKSAILADEVVCMRIPAFSMHKTVKVWKAFGYLSKEEQQTREKEYNKFFDPGTGIKNTISFLHKYDVKHILLDLTRTTSSQKKKISQNRSLFEKIYSKNNFVLYEVKFGRE